MKILKRILLLFLLLLIVAYLGMAITAFNRKPVGQVCNNVELLLKDSLSLGLITQTEVISILEKSGINPMSMELDQIHTQTIEQILLEHPLIDRVESYKTPSGKLCIEVTQRTPLLRIMSDNGENYYIDNHGTIMSADRKCVAHLPIATGKIEKSFATKELYKFAVFLQKNSFWNAQIEQIHVLPQGNVELVPRVGDHLIYLGKLEHLETKLDRVKRFYEKGLNQVGWNKYSQINVEFTNQIICTRRE